MEPKTDKEIFWKMLLNAKIDAKVDAWSFRIERGYAGLCVDIAFDEKGNLVDIAAVESGERNQDWRQ